MDVYEFFREYARMFRTYRKDVTITNMYITVEGIAPWNQEVSVQCATSKEEIDKIIQWAKDNPQKTRLQDFKEKHQNAEFSQEGIPEACAGTLGYCSSNCVGSLSCSKCWNEPVE